MKKIRHKCVQYNQLVHKSGITVAESRWWRLWADFSTSCSWTNCEQKDWREQCIRASATDELPKDLNIATQQRRCRRDQLRGLQAKWWQRRELLPITPNRRGELFFPGCTVLTLLLFLRELLLANTRASGCTRATHVWAALQETSL